MCVWGKGEPKRRKKGFAFRTLWKIDADEKCVPGRKKGTVFAFSVRIDICVWTILVWLGDKADDLVAWCREWRHFRSFDRRGKKKDAGAGKTGLGVSHFLRTMQTERHRIKAVVKSVMALRHATQNGATWTQTPGCYATPQLLRCWLAL